MRIGVKSRGDRPYAKRPARPAAHDSITGGSIQLKLGLGVADDLVAALLGHRVHHHGAVAGLLDGARHRDLLLGHAHAAELHGEALEGARIAAGRAHVGARHLGHAIEAVKDVARQAHLLGELVVDVDRVEVARGARVAVREVLVRRDLQLGDLIALVHGESNSGARPADARSALLIRPSRCWSRCRARPRRRPGWWTPTRTRSCLLYTSDAADDLLCVDLG